MQGIRNRLTDRLCRGRDAAIGAAVAEALHVERAGGQQLVDRLLAERDAAVAAAYEAGLAKGIEITAGHAALAVA